MFDFAWSELALIGVVALIAIGPKDMPLAIKTVTQFIRKARGMAAEFQTHVEDLVKEADLHEVRDQIRDLRNLDLRGAIEKHVDPDGSLSRAFEDPMGDMSGLDGTMIDTLPAMAALEESPPPPKLDLPPEMILAFIPPWAEAAHQSRISAPSFIPPGFIAAAGIAPAFLPPPTIAQPTIAQPTIAQPAISQPALDPPARQPAEALSVSAQTRD